MRNTFGEVVHYRRIVLKKLTDDHRTRVTRILIRRAFLALLEKKPIQSISVKELCALAGINRSTFYAHYTDLNSLLQQIEDEMFAEFETALQPLCAAAGQSSLLGVTTGIFRCLHDNSDLCTVTLGDYGDKAFAYRLLERGRRACMESYLAYFRAAAPQRIEYYYAFVSAGCIGLLRRWLDNGMLSSPAEMAQMTEQIMVHGIGFLGEGAAAPSPAAPA